MGGNGKTHRTPSPGGLRKIKIVSLEVFLRLKELVNSVKVDDPITPRGNRKKSILRCKKLGVAKQNHANEYEPSKIINTYNGPLWQWRRVADWQRYINDPCENKSGHIVT